MVLAYQFNFKIGVVTTMTTLVCCATAENFFEMFSYFFTKSEFDFVANILSNVSALKAGREFLVEEML